MSPSGWIFLGRNYVPYIHLHYPHANTLDPPAAAETDEVGGRAVQANFQPPEAFSQPPPAKFRSRRLTSLGCRRDGGRASSARQALPREELTGLLSPGAGEALKASLPVHISPGYCVTSPAPPRKPATSFRQSRAQRCPLAASEGADTDNLGRQEAKGFRACLQDLRQNEERRAALVRAQRRPQDVHTAQFTVGGSRIRTSNLRLLPPFSLRVQEAKHSFPCLWKNPNSLAPEQRTPDPHQLGSASHKPPIPACWPKWCQELAG